MKFVCLLAAAVGLAAAQSPSVPRPVKTLTFTVANSRQPSLADYKGKVVVVQFLITNCVHCQAFSRTLAKLQAELGPKGFQALGVAINDPTPDMLRKYTHDQETNFPVGSAPRERALDCLDISQLARIAVPQVLLIDRSGIIRAQSDPLGTPELQDESTLRSLIATLLAKEHS